MNDKIAKILNGESEQFTTKEILIEHMRSSQDFRKDVREKLECINSKVVKHGTAIKYITIGLGGVIMVISWILLELYGGIK